MSKNALWLRNIISGCLAKICPRAWWGRGNPHPLIVTIPTALCLVLGLDALAFGPLSALGLRVSLLDFFCDFAMRYSS
jgi:hypothetical protein